MQSLLEHVVEQIKRIAGGLLAVGVIADERAAIIRGEDLGGEEVLVGKGRLPGARGADQHDHGEFGDGCGLEVAHA